MSVPGDLVATQRGAPRPTWCSVRGWGAVGADDPGDVVAVENLHLAFSGPDDATVQAFHAAATAAGYRDNGPPGERPAYGRGYYGAFVLDPDGNNVEVVHFSE
jgi:catechol 2,3-dioxygenase-like lactoylglutathione lyase family enzyme